MWNISFALPTLFIILIILAFYFSLPRLSIRKNRAFVRLIIVESLVVLTDVLASHMDNNYQEYSLLVLCLGNSAYFVAFFIRSFTVYDFTESALKIKATMQPLPFALPRIPVILAVITALTSPVTRFIFYIDEKGYHSGPFYNVIYVYAFIYLVLAFAILFVFGHRIPRKREKYTLYLFNLFILAGFIVRIIFPTYLLMDTFCLIAIIVLCLTMENPDYYLELRGTVFNIKALREVIDENIDNLNYRFVGVTVREYYEMRDIYGSSQMDTTLQLLGKYLASNFKNCMTFYVRKGRFVVLAPGEADSREICGQIDYRFKDPWEIDDARVFVNVGFSCADLVGINYSVDVIMGTFTKLLNNPQSMSSKGLVLGTREDFARTEKETEVRKCLDKAIETKSVEVFLQPIIDAETESVIGAEALARIRDFDGNIISPNLFVPIAEKGGRINELGELVLEKTCKFIRELETVEMGLQWINVNLSPIQFLQPNLAEKYESIVWKNGVSPEKIHLEITEEAIMDSDFIIKQAQGLIDKGFGLVLDDYGTGYSNLSRLRMIPFMNIKIDKSLVWSYCEKHDEVISALVGAFKRMGIDVTAEGVEDKEMVEKMGELGVDYLQGFRYSKPIAMKEFVKKYG